MCFGAWKQRMRQRQQSYHDGHRPQLAAADHEEEGKEEGGRGGSKRRTWFPKRASREKTGVFWEERAGCRSRTGGVEEVEANP
jgi:hypothetical protein